MSRIVTTQEPSDKEEDTFFEAHIYKVEVLNIDGVDEWKELLRKELAKDSSIDSSSCITTMSGRFAIKTLVKCFFRMVSW